MKDALIRPAKQIGIAVGVLLVLYLVAYLLSAALAKPGDQHAEERRAVEIEADGIATRIKDDGSYLVEDGEFHSAKFSFKLPFNDAAISTQKSEYQSAGSGVKSYEYSISKADGHSAEMRVADIELDDRIAERQVIEAAGRFLDIEGVDLENPEIAELDIGKKKFVKLTYSEPCEDAPCENPSAYYDLFITAINDNRFLFVIPGRYETEIVASILTR